MQSFKVLPLTQRPPVSLQPRKIDQQARRQSHVHFQTPEANVVSEAADPYQDDRNNSSKAGSTPFQAKSLRRVSFAAADKAADQTSAPQSNAEVTSNVPQSASTFALAKRWLDNSSAEMLSPVECPTAAAGISADSTDPHQLPSDATANAGDQSEAEDDDTDDSSSIGTISIAAGSTPYLNRSMLSAALRAATFSDQPAVAAADNVGGDMDHAEGADLTDMMARLLSAELNTQDELADDAPDDNNQVSVMIVSRWPAMPLLT